MTTEHEARINGKDLPISTKQTIEICNLIRGKTTEKAKAILQRVMGMEQAVPMKRFNKDTGHKPGKIAAGRYPLKAASEILKLVDGVEANAQNKGLDTTSLSIKTVIANKASTPWRYGRQRRRKMKRTHLSIIVEEFESSKKKEVTKKQQTKETQKEEIKDVPKEIKKLETKQVKKITKEKEEKKK